MKQGAQAVRRAVVLGGYGLIGSACLRALRDAGFDVTAVGRDGVAAARVLPGVPFRRRDIARATATDWARDLAGVDVVVNASGALQDGARDDLAAIHQHAIEALVAGLEGTTTRVIQISAAGAHEAAETAFFATKARGDEALMGSSLDWVVLRPTLVLGRAAYGGTALLRAAAAMPLIGFDVLPQVPVQTVALDDLTAAVVACARGDIPPGTCADLTAPEVHRLSDLTTTLRAWMGLRPWRLRVPVPRALLALTSGVADALGWLGWRSPLRRTTLDVLKDGVRGDPACWAAAGGAPCRSLSETLAAMPATVQDRWFARLFLLLPIAIATLALFWLLSGLIGLIHADVAMAVLTSRAIPDVLAALGVYVGALIDVALGLGVLLRRFARRACLSMIAVSAGYLLAGTILAPDLWTDPLGPFLKILPAMVLAGFVAALMDDR